MAGARKRGVRPRAAESEGGVSIRCVIDVVPGAPISDARVRRIVSSHFDPGGGSAYWIEKARALGIDPHRHLRRLHDLDLLGTMDAGDLRERSVWDFVPARLQGRPERFTCAETGGTTGRPARTAYGPRDFRLAFVAPFLAAAARTGFPRGKRWAYIGPSGPHVIGKAARAVCRAMGSPDPFAVDFDPRWYRAQPPGSLLRGSYLEHVLGQALDILDREPVEALFGTPPVLAALGARLPVEQRLRVAAVHLGGLAAEPTDEAALRHSFPGALFLSGYGNTLLGMCPQLDPGLEHPVYYPHGERLRIRLVRPDAPGETALDEPVGPGERGRVVASRLDDSFLLVNLLERDTAVRHPPHPEGPPLGFLHEGIGDPRPLVDIPVEQLGIY
jgi:phenylacetate-coenzyme A ligase PaaK-like adenylate-forming protein